MAAILDATTLAMVCREVDRAKTEQAQAKAFPIR
jgi:hypothetical protein